MGLGLISNSNPIVKAMIHDCKGNDTNGCGRGGEVIVNN
jgi:hypothetical protein